MRCSRRPGKRPLRYELDYAQYWSNPIRWIQGTGADAQQLQTLAITLYYPSALAPLASQPWARPWLPQPISLIGTGYARLIGIHAPPLQSLVTFFLWALGSKTVIPGVVDAPVLSSINVTNDDEEALGKVITKVGMAGKVKGEGTVEETLELRDDNVESKAGLRIETGMGKLPAVVFTHGMAGMSQSYSHYLGSIASHGYIVAAVEHRDGSGPGTIVHHANGSDRFVWHLKLDDLE
jgi:platelet-activating factor acetylhydrolase